MKIVIIVDAQNDFITGPLGSPEAQAAVPNIVNKLKEYENTETLILFTKDTHYDNYMETQEGHNLPVPHCINGTPGWSIAKPISSVGTYGNFYKYSDKDIINSRILKETFGSIRLAKLIADLTKENAIEEVVFMGFCTDICVVSNVLLTKAYSPELPITVVANCCAGVTPEKHEAALETMRSCQIKVI